MLAVINVSFLKAAGNICQAKSLPVLEEQVLIGCENI